MTLHVGEILRRVRAAFDEAGYDTYYRLINAADYGVPQRRDRRLKYYGPVSPPTQFHKYLCKQDYPF